jgi:hypothetical protein
MPRPHTIVVFAHQTAGTVSHPRISAGSDTGLRTAPGEILPSILDPHAEYKLLHNCLGLPKVLLNLQVSATTRHLQTFEEFRVAISAKQRKVINTELLDGMIQEAVSATMDFHANVGYFITTLVDNSAVIAGTADIQGRIYLFFQL